MVVEQPRAIFALTGVVQARLRHAPAAHGAPGVELLAAGGAAGRVDAEGHAAQVVAVQVEQPARRARRHHLALQRVEHARRHDHAALHVGLQYARQVERRQPVVRPAQSLAVGVIAVLLARGPDW